MEFGREGLDRMKTLFFSTVSEKELQLTHINYYSSWMISSGVLFLCFLKPLLKSSQGWRVIVFRKRWHSQMAHGLGGPRLFTKEVVQINTWRQAYLHQLGCFQVYSQAASMVSFSKHLHIRPIHVWRTQGVCPCVWRVYVSIRIGESVSIMSFFDISDAKR